MTMIPQPRHVIGMMGVPDVVGIRDLGARLRMGTSFVAMAAHHLNPPMRPVQGRSVADLRSELDQIEPEAGT